MRIKFKLSSITTFLVLVLLVMSFAGCGGDTATPDEAEDPVTEEQEDEHAEDEAEDEHADDDHEDEASLSGNSVRGGLLYDKWWAVSAGEEEHEHEGDDHDELGQKPEGDHPLWATQSTNTRSGTDTWRCKECHGWDYKGVDGAYGSSSHTTGFPGVYASSNLPASEVLAAMKGATNPDHDFSTVMPEQDLVDLALFITEALINTPDLINTDKSSVGNAAEGEELFTSICAKCHGPEGNAINFSSLDDPEFLGHLAPDNPWEFVHKVRFGQPGWPMPSAIKNDWSMEDIANVLAYAQTFTEDSPVSWGAQMYDKWWSYLGVDAPEIDNPLWATQDTNTRSGSDTWRCKECHGWDYQGVDGAYASGSHSTGFAGILAASAMTAEELTAWLNGSTNPDHDFSPYMEDYALEALVAFIQNEMVDITPYVNADKTVNGDPAKGRNLYEGTCTFCHGVDGKLINFGGDDDPEYLGTVASGNPWEFFHKASFGQPGAPMPAGLALGWSLQDIADLLAYVQTLPTE